MAEDWNETMKPCPRCGGQALPEVEQIYDPVWHLLELTYCGSCGAKTKSFLTREEADAAWNRGELISDKPNG